MGVLRNVLYAVQDFNFQRWCVKVLKLHTSLCTVWKPSRIYTLRFSPSRASGKLCYALFKESLIDSPCFGFWLSFGTSFSRCFHPELLGKEFISQGQCLASIANFCYCYSQMGVSGWFLFPCTCSGPVDSESVQSELLYLTDESA